MAIQLQDKLYTSAQVADILGVSLRTLYRYMEDGRILSMRTASGRHRFTKDQIMDFLNAGNIIDEEADNNLVHPKPIVKNPVLDEPTFVDRSFKPQPAVRAVPEDDMDFDFRGIQNKPESVAPVLNHAPDYMNSRPASNPVEFQQSKPYSPYQANIDQDVDGFQGTVRRPFSPVQPVVPTHRDLETEDEFLRKESLELDDDVLDTPTKNTSFGLDDDFDVDEYFDTKKSATLEKSPSFTRSESLGAMRPVGSMARPMSNVEAPSVARANPYKGFESDGYTPINRPAPVAERPIKSSWEFSSERKANLNSEPLLVSKEEVTPKSTESLNVRYYKSEFTDLIDLAKKIKETGSARGVDYAFTLNAGLSLHFSINPFELLHFYINPEDLQVWKSDLKLSPVREADDANIGILINTEIIFPQTKEIGGFKVLEDKLLFKDLVKLGDQDLVRRFRPKVGI